LPHPCLHLLDLPQLVPLPLVQPELVQPELVDYLPLTDL
jgi:hypothetical protein